MEKEDPYTIEHAKNIIEAYLNAFGYTFQVEDLVLSTTRSAYTYTIVKPESRVPQVCDFVVSIPIRAQIRPHGRLCTITNEIDLIEFFKSNFPPSIIPPKPKSTTDTKTSLYTFEHARNTIKAYLKAFGYTFKIETSRLPMHLPDPAWTYAFTAVNKENKVSSTCTFTDTAPIKAQVEANSEWHHIANETDLMEFLGSIFPPPVDPPIPKSTINEHEIVKTLLKLVELLENARQQ